MNIKINNNRFIQFLSLPINQFKNFDISIKKYMIMHWMGGFLLIYTIILPIYMNRLGIEITTVGILFSIAGLSDVILTLILSRFLDRISPNIAIILDWITESIPPFIYFLATTPIHFFIGILSGNVTNILNPAYRVYENEIYPENKRSLLYTYHLMTPELFTFILYPIIGYLLTYKFNSILAIKILFLFCSIGFIGVSVFSYKNLKWIKPIDVKRDEIKISLSGDLWSIALAEIFIIAGLEFVSTFVTSYYILDKLKGSILSVLLIESIGGLITILGSMISEKMQTKIKEIKMAQYGLFLFIVFSIFMIFGKSYMVIFIAYIIRPIGHILWFPNHNALLMKYIPRDKRGYILGSISSIKKLVYIVIPLLSGFLISSFGFSFIFIASFIFLSSSFLIYFFMSKYALN